MLILYGFGPAFGLPAASPFAIKADVQLKMAGIPYTYGAGGNPQDGPKGKIPYIEDDGERIGDSHFIRRHVEKKYGVDLDAPLSGAERARAWAIERMLEEHLYWALVHERWMDDANFAKGPANFFNALPDAVRDTVRRETRERVRATLHSHGLGRHTRDEVLELAKRSLASLASELGDKPCLFGEELSGTDATAFAFATSVLTPWFAGPLRDAALAHGNLVAYSARLMQRYYPELAQQAA